MGKVVLLGAGPGDPKLLTIKGLEYISGADCIVYDRLVSDEIIAMAKPDCEKIYVGKANHNHTLPQEEINELLYKKALECELVVRLKGGDPYVFGRGGEEALFLTERGISVDVVPGITSAIAVAAYGGIPITHRGIAKGFHVITSHSKTDDIASIDFTLLKDEEETCVFLMGLSHVEEIARRLIVAGRRPDTPIAVISNGTKNNQKKCIARLDNISESMKDKDIKSPAIIVVGDVVKLADRLSFFENRPLFGKKYVVPYTLAKSFSFDKGWRVDEENRLTQSIKTLGADVVSIKVGRIEPIRIDLEFLSELNDNDYIIFTSKNAVNSLMWNLKLQGRDIRSLGKAKIAVVGKKTAKELEGFGLVCDVISKGNTALDLADELMEGIDKNSRVVWLNAKVSNRDLANAISDKCRFTELCCYENIECDTYDSELLSEKMVGSDGVIFTSGSNVDRFISRMKKCMPSAVYSIGPTCTEHLKAAGIADAYEASEASYEGLIDIVLSLSKLKN